MRWGVGSGSEVDLTGTVRASSLPYKENLMTRTADDTRIPLAGCTAVDAETGAERDLGALDGVTVLVLLRHRH